MSRHSDPGRCQQEAYKKQEVPGQSVPPEVVERRREAYEELRHEGLLSVLDKLEGLRRSAARAAARAERMAAGEETSAEELQELQRAGLVDPIAKAQAEAKAMMAIEVERQHKLMESREKKAARELEKVVAAEALATEKWEEQQRVEALFKAKKAAQREEINQRRQEAALWRVQRAVQQEKEAEAALVSRDDVAGIWVAFFQRVPAMIVRPGRGAQAGARAGGEGREDQAEVRRYSLAAQSHGPLGSWAALLAPTRSCCACAAGRWSGAR